MTAQLRNDFPEVNFLTSLSTDVFDFVAVLCGCESACADHRDLHGLEGKMVITAEADYARLSAAIHSLKPRPGVVSMNNLICEKNGDVTILTVNRPKALNALNNETVAELSGCLSEIAAEAPRCLIITGAGDKAFIAGADISEMVNMMAEQAEELCLKGNEVMSKLENFPVPVIAAVNGFALGGGFELALSCDLRLASDNAVFSLPEVGLGIIPGYGGMQRLARTVGLGKAKELIYTADRLKAGQALEIGLVNAVYPQDSLLNEAIKMAEKISANAPVAIRAAKKVINDSLGLSLAEACCLEKKALAECFVTQDKQMAMSAFLEKKKPGAFAGQ